MINQISTANTFEQWLIATQQLISKENFYEETIDLVYVTANNIYSASNTVNTNISLGSSYISDKSNNVNATAQYVQDVSNTVNTNTSLAMAFVHNISNTINTTAQSFNITVTTASNYTNTAYDTANLAYDIAVEAMNLVYTITDDTTSNIVIYPISLSNTSGFADEAYVSSSKFKYTPSTGTLSSPTMNCSNITINGNTIINSSGHITNTVVGIVQGGTGSNTASSARTNLGLGSISTLNSINNDIWSGTDLSVVNGGTGASDASAARTNLGAQSTLVSGTNIKSIDGITLLGSGNMNILPSGTVLLFVQTSAPTGWTKSTTHNDKVLRVVSGTASSGGLTDFSSVFTSRTPSGSVGGTELTESQMPKHWHRMKGPNAGDVPQGGADGWSIYGGGTPDDGGWAYGTWSVGGGAASGSYSTGTGNGASHSHSFTGSSLDFNVKYVDAIIAIKD